MPRKPRVNFGPEKLAQTEARQAAALAEKLRLRDAAMTGSALRHREFLDAVEDIFEFARSEFARVDLEIKDSSRQLRP